MASTVDGAFAVESSDSASQIGGAVARTLGGSSVVAVPTALLQSAPAPLIKHCWFGCGTSGSAETMVNVATRAYPRYVCHCCQNSRVALERQYRKAKLNEQLTAMKRDHSEVWKAKVRACRIDPQELGAVSDTCRT